MHGIGVEDFIYIKLDFIVTNSIIQQCLSYPYYIQVFLKVNARQFLSFVEEGTGIGQLGNYWSQTGMAGGTWTTKGSCHSYNRCVFTTLRFCMVNPFSTFAMRAFSSRLASDNFCRSFRALNIKINARMGATEMEVTFH